MRRFTNENVEDKSMFCDTHRKIQQPNHLELLGFHPSLTNRRHIPYPEALIQSNLALRYRQSDGNQYFG